MFQHECIQGVGIWPSHHAEFSACGRSFTATGRVGVFIQTILHSLTAAPSLQQVSGSNQISTFPHSFFCLLLWFRCHSCLHICLCLLQHFELKDSGKFAKDNHHLAPVGGASSQACSQRVLQSYQKHKTSVCLYSHHLSPASADIVSALLSGSQQVQMTRCVQSELCFHDSEMLLECWPPCNGPRILLLMMERIWWIKLLAVTRMTLSSL